MKVAVIDIGSNTVRLIVYTMHDKTFKQLVSKKIMLGLASCIENKTFTSEGIAKLTDALSQLKHFCKMFYVEHAYYFATASLRNVSNKKEVLQHVKHQLEIEIELLSQDQEGLYDFYGSRLSMNVNSGWLIDIGGGSSEIVGYEKDHIFYNASMPVGSLNLYADYVDYLFPKKAEVKNIKARIKKELNALPDKPKNHKMTTAIGVGGSIRALLLLIRKEVKVKDLNAFSKKDVEMMLDLILDDMESSAHKILRIKPDRIHTIVPGMLILLQIMNAYGIERILISHTGLREGYLMNRYQMTGGEYYE
ncbi:MAG: hypothetical protein ACLROI_07825 [Beduini sp.]|uniref:Ppx/GppA phosphatase family protein n=1 Tax=Beduini sp. TaxID=1922300 RepID=UPI0011C81655